MIFENPYSFIIKLKLRVYQFSNTMDTLNTCLELILTFYREKNRSVSYSVTHVIR